MMKKIWLSLIFTVTVIPFSAHAEEIKATNPKVVEDLAVDTIDAAKTATMTGLGNPPVPPATTNTFGSAMATQQVSQPAKLISTRWVNGSRIAEIQQNGKVARVTVGDTVVGFGKIKAVEFDSVVMVGKKGSISLYLQRD